MFFMLALVENTDISHKQNNEKLRNTILYFIKTCRYFGDTF